MCNEWSSYQGKCGHSVYKPVKEECDEYKANGKCQNIEQNTSWCTRETLRELNIEPIRCDRCYSEKITRYYEEVKASAPNDSGISNLTKMHLYITKWPDLPFEMMDRIHTDAMMKWKWSRILTDVRAAMVANDVCGWAEADRVIAEIQKDM